MLADQTALAKNAKKKSTGSVGRSLGRIDDDLFIPKKKKGGFKVRDLDPGCVSTATTEIFSFLRV